MHTSRQNGKLKIVAAGTSARTTVRSGLACRYILTADMFVALTPTSDGVPLLLRQLDWLLRQPLFWAIAGILIGPYLFYRGFRLLQRKRLILDIPRSTVRAAAMGAVELSGKAVGPHTLVAPLSERDCLYYRVVIRLIQKRDIIDEVCTPLFVDDGTGALMLYPKGAEMQLTPYESLSGTEYLGRVVSRHGFNRKDIQSVEEFCILPSENIFVMGTLQENPWAKETPDSSLSRIGPGFVSQGEADLLRREAFPYLNPDLPSGCSSGREFNLSPPTILMQGRHPFVISNHSQREITSELAWKSFAFIWGGPIWTVWSLWQILSNPNISRVLRFR